MSRDHPAANQALKPVEASWCGSNEATSELKTRFSSFFTVPEPLGSRSFVGRDKEGVSYPHWPLLRSTPPLTACYGPWTVSRGAWSARMCTGAQEFSIPMRWNSCNLTSRSCTIRSQSWRCANIVGAMDGSHVRIKVPSDSTADYFSRYQQHEFYFILS